MRVRRMRAATGTRVGQSNRRRADRAACCNCSVIGFYGTKELASVMTEGLCIGVTRSLGCPAKHICIAQRPEVAANFGMVVAVDLRGLDLAEEGFV